MRYVALCLPSLKQLQDQVNRFIEDGWEPQGGLAVVPDPEGVNKEARRFGNLWAQAMIRKEPEQ
jgi:hypothetical protein